MTSESVDQSICLKFVSKINFYHTLKVSNFAFVCHKLTSGFRGARSAPNSARTLTPAETNLAAFEVKMADFPELAGVSLSKAIAPVIQKDCWGPSPLSTSPQSPMLASSFRVKYHTLFCC